MDELLDKVAVITGAAGGIGAATALAFAREGAKGIMIADINADSARILVDRIRGETRCTCEFAKTDVANPEQIVDLFRRTLAVFARLDILVNCAGICTTSSVDDTTVGQWDRTHAINLRGSFLCSREAMIIMKKQRSGTIINISSISGQIGGIATGMDYCTSKGALITLTMSLAKAGGPFGISVNAVAPGFIRTEMTKGFTHFDPEAVPLRRIGEPEDVADVIVFLAGRKARYITGETININGGVYMS